MDLRYLRSFLAVAERLNFSQAAAALHITQPALSRQIRELEEKLGCRLFERRPKGISLTEDGALFRPRAERLVREADELTREMQSRGRGRPAVVRLAHFGTFLALYLVPFLERLHRCHPRWRVELLELNSEEALRQLASGAVDAAAISRPEPAGLGGLESRVIWRQTPLIVLPAAHMLAKRRQLRLRELAKERLLVWDEAKFPGFGAPFVAACRKAGFEPQVAGTVDDVAVAFTAVAREDAVTYVGRLAGRLPPPGIAFVPLADGELDMPTMLAWRGDAPGASLVAELAAMLAAEPPAQ